jgi:hypothetical protein
MTIAIALACLFVGFICGAFTVAILSVAAKEPPVPSFVTKPCAAVFPPVDFGKAAVERIEALTAERDEWQRVAGYLVGMYAPTVNLPEAIADAQAAVSK